MTEPSLPELEAERDRLYAQLSAVGDFRRGSVSENYRRCGKPNCACAARIIPGTGRGSCGPGPPGDAAPLAGSSPAAEVEKVRREVARHGEFAAISEQIAEVNEKICEARPVAGTDAPSGARGRKGGLFGGARAGESRRDRPAWQRMAAQVAGLRRRRAGGCRGRDPRRDAAGGLRHAGQLLAADPGYRGPRVPCGQGHPAEFVSYRDKVIDTVLGPVTLTRAWYHCAACGHGLRPADAELGVAGASMSPGLRSMNDQAAAAGPFAKAARLLENLAGVRLTVKRVERAAEASGAAAAAAVRDRAALITARKLVPLPPSPLPDKLYAAIDGTGVPITAKETAGRDGKGEDGRARTREVKLAVFFTQDKLDDEGYPVRDRDSSSYIATFEPAAAFAGPGEGRRHPPRRRSRPPAHHPRRRRRLDLEHRQHASSPKPPRSWTCSTPASTCTTSPASWNSCSLDRKDEWLAARLEDLDYGDIDGICKAARLYPLERRQERPSSTQPSATSRTTPPACATTGSAPAACSSAPERRSRVQSSHRPAPQAVRHALDRRRRQTPSPRCAASRPAAPQTGSGTHRATRHQPPDQPNHAKRSCSPIAAPASPTGARCDRRRCRARTRPAPRRPRAAGRSPARTGRT